MSPHLFDLLCYWSTCPHGLTTAKLSSHQCRIQSANCFLPYFFSSVQLVFPPNRYSQLNINQLSTVSLRPTSILFNQQLVLFGEQFSNLLFFSCSLLTLSSLPYSYAAQHHIIHITSRSQHFLQRVTRILHIIKNLTSLQKLLSWRFLERKTFRTAENFCVAKRG